MKNCLHENHPDIGRAYTSLGSAYIAQGENKKSAQFYEKGLEIMKTKITRRASRYWKNLCWFRIGK